MKAEKTNKAGVLPSHYGLGIKTVSGSLSFYSHLGLDGKFI